MGGPSASLGPMRAQGKGPFALLPSPIFVKKKKKLHRKTTLEVKTTFVALVAVFCFSVFSFVQLFYDWSGKQVAFRETEAGDERLPCWAEGGGIFR